MPNGWRAPCRARPTGSAPPPWRTSSCASPGAGWGAEMSHRVLYVWRRNMKVWLRYWASNLVTNFVEPFVYLLGLGFGLGQYVRAIEGVPYATFIAPGIVASSAMFAASFETTFGTYVRLEFQKTFDAIIATPVSVDDVSAGELLYGATKSTLFAAVVLVAVLVTRIVPDARWTDLFVPVVALLGGLIFGALGM